MIESIEKLRELAADMNTTEIIDHLDVVGKFMFHADWLDSWHKAFDAACDEITREIAERYIELPVDADGVPIKLGDRLAWHDAEGYSGEMIVDCIELYRSDRDRWSVHDIDDCLELSPLDCRHVKPRTVEDVLHDFARDVLSMSRNRFAESPDEIYIPDGAKYAAELREMLGREDG